jgi:hypothetical protein
MILNRIIGIRLSNDVLVEYIKYPTKIGKSHDQKVIFSNYAHQIRQGHSSIVSRKWKVCIAISLTFMKTKFIYIRLSIWDTEKFEIV